MSIDLTTISITDAERRALIATDYTRPISESSDVRIWAAEPVQMLHSGSAVVRVSFEPIAPQR